MKEKIIARVRHIVEHKFAVGLLVATLVVAVSLIGCIATPSEASTAEDISKDVSTEISESSVTDVSEPSETSAETDASADGSGASKDPSEESDGSTEPSDEPSDEVSKEQEDNPSAPDEASKEESSRPDEVSKEDEESRVEETSKNEETSKAEDTKPTHTHTWAKATCTAPKTCKTCGVTEGNATDHDWQSATCLAPQACKVCGTTIGSVTAHLYENGACKHCGDEQEVVHGDTPVDIVINGKQESVGSYEEAVKALTLKDLENMAAGEKIDVVYKGTTLKFTANGDGTFVDAVTGRSCNAQRVYNFYISQFCSDCGKRKGNGENGTCVKYLHDTESCHRCGKPAKALECHTCGE